MSNVSVDVEDRTYIIRQALMGGAEAGLKKAAFDIEAQAKINVRDADKVDTGALVNSIYSIAPGHSNHAAAASAAQVAAAKPGKHSGKPHDVTLLPVETVGELEGLVSVGADYGGVVENGNAFTEPSPFLGPAAERVLSELDAVLVNETNKRL